MKILSYSKIIDLSYSINGLEPSWPSISEPGPQIFSTKLLTTYKDHGFISRVIEIPEHYSTHIDAPAHCVEGNQTIDQIQAENLICPGAVIDVRVKANINPDYSMSIEDITNWEVHNGKIPENSVVMMNSGWGAKWQTKKEFINQDESGFMHFPGFSKEAVEFLLFERNINGLGIDTLSIDPGISDDFSVHKILFSQNKFALENLANIDKLTPIVPAIIIAPLKTEGGSGSPARIFALIL